MTATSGRGSRNKGANAERELARILSELTGMQIRRGQVFNGEPDLVGLEGIHVEAKRQDRLNVHAAFDQSKTAAAKHRDGMPTVMYRRDRDTWKVVMNLDDWVQLYRAWRTK